MDLHKAIRAVHNSVVTINGDTQETIIAKDSSENDISINWTQVNAWTDTNKYQTDRVYPSIGDQLDMLWHSIDRDAELKSKYFDFHQAILAVKSKNPK